MKLIKLGSSDNSPVKIISPDPKNFYNERFSSFGQESAAISKKLSVTPIAADPAEVD